MPISTPPLNYLLERPGTSGISTGPELAILDGAGGIVPHGGVGRISVRGEPLFSGYLKFDGSLDRSVFNEAGWFDTGDLGYMDADGYLYITGRSKEVINRGGELISPFEVENAIIAAASTESSPLFGRVSQTLAFSTSHDVLQEVVGVVIATPPDAQRPDLRLLHKSLKQSLQQIKWPVLIVYMDDLPKKNNKVLRIRLSERLGLPLIGDETSFFSRHWEATCPPPDVDLSVPIIASLCPINLAYVQETALILARPSGFGTHVRLDPIDGTLQTILAQQGDLANSAVNLKSDFPDRMLSTMENLLDGYLLPNRVVVMPRPFPMDATGIVQDDLLQKILDEMASTSYDVSGSTEGRVRRLFSAVLSCDPGEIQPGADFFDLGGDSLRAGKLLSRLRSEFKIQLPFDLIFAHGTVDAISSYIDKHALAAEGGSSPYADGKQHEGVPPLPTSQQTYSSKNPWLLMLQLVPLFVVYPLRRAFQWTAFVVVLSYAQYLKTNESIPGRLLNLTLSILIARALVRLVFPWIGIATKWLIIGRYQAGIYPMWGSYHTRWWVVQKTVSICGLGVFGVSNSTRVWHARLMGARIGANVTLPVASTTALGEWDLLEIGDGATLDRCICRPFAGERNATMLLDRVVIGRDASVGLASTVAPGTVLPDGACIGPNSSSWELENDAIANNAIRNLLAANMPTPHWALQFFGTLPLSLISWFISQTPWLAGLAGLVIKEPLTLRTPLISILDWFASGSRVSYHYLALILRAMISPFLCFVFAVMVKFVLDCCFGKLEPSLAGQTRSQIDIWRRALLKSTLMPGSKLHEMTELMGAHYEGTSVAIRLLGGRVGKRVYWPGTGPSIGDYDLLDIGNDVVFGSRAHLVTSDATGSQMIRIGDGAMIADRVCVLPGVAIGERTVLGSGALTRRDKVYPPRTTYIGSKGGDAISLTTDRSSHSSFTVQGSSTSVNSSSGRGNDDDKIYPPSPISSGSTTDLESGLGEHLGEKGQDSPNFSESYISPSVKKGEAHLSPSSGLDPTSLSPFGRAFHLKQAPYYVLSPWLIFAYSTFITVFTTVYWNVPNITAIQIIQRMFHRYETAIERGLRVEIPLLYLISFILIALLSAAQIVLALSIVIASKWALLGRRAPGNYDWDRSSYCQRWQVFLTIERLRRHCFGGQGVLVMLTGTYWLVLYYRALGASIGDDCALFANGSPALMLTEPDLLTLGDRVVVDLSLIHI